MFPYRISNIVKFKELCPKVKVGYSESAKVAIALGFIMHNLCLGESSITACTWYLNLVKRRADT